LEENIFSFIGLFTNKTHQSSKSYKTISENILNDNELKNQKLPIRGLLGVNKLI